MPEKRTPSIESSMNGTEMENNSNEKKIANLTKVNRDALFFINKKYKVVNIMKYYQRSTKIFINN